MKILIISSGRAGSTSLLSGLNQGINNSTLFFEPLNERFAPFIYDEVSYTNHKTYLSNISNSIIVKSLIFQPTNVKDKINFYLDYQKIFDNVILLVRKNQKQTSESFTISRFTDQFHSPYEASGFLNNPNIKKAVNHQLEVVKNYNNNLYKLSKLLNIPLTYYENLFGGNQEYIKNWLSQNKIPIDNFQKLYDKLNPMYKYRKN